jgi:hypothetical protein
MTEALNPFPTTNEKVDHNNRKGETTDWSSPHHSTDDRQKRFPAQETLLGSYLHQQYRFGNLSLTETEEETEDHNVNGFIFTAWNQFGQPTQEEQNLKQNEELKAFLDEKQFKYEPILTLASNYRWLEDAYLVKGINNLDAENIATAFGQLAFVTLNENKAIVRLTTNASFMGLPRDTRLETFISTKEVTYNHCPARYPAADENKCKMIGGPYGSAAIHASAIWSTTRAIFLKRLGCTPCNKGTQPVNGPGGGPILLNQPELPSRFGGFQWPIR